MKGVYASHDRTLADALQPIAGLAASLDWCVQLQSGPFRDNYRTEADDPRNLLRYFHDFSGGEPAWFRSGLLPQYANELVLDEWSVYLGFDPKAFDARQLAKRLDDDIGISPAILELVCKSPMIYLIRVDAGWWEAYTGFDKIIDTIMCDWFGRVTDGGRWAGDETCDHPEGG